MQYSESEEWYRCLFEQASDLIVIHDLDGAIVNANDSLFNRFGYTREELKKGRSIFSEWRCVCKDGSIVEIEANLRKMSDDLVLGVCRDVTRQRAVERELREAEIKFRNLSNEIIQELLEANLHTILDNTDTVYVLLDTGLTILSYNQRALDFAASELGHHMVSSDHFLDYFPARRRTAITKWMNKVIAGEASIMRPPIPNQDLLLPGIA